MLDFFKDIFSAFKQSSIERIKNPFIGAFAFSWIGFNWQIVAIILFSKKDVIDRIEYIKNNYDVGGFILAPVLTAIVICIALPEANKLFTRLQKKPLDDTTKILMGSKIAIAKEQLQIADIEAKKKLAHKREERNIEENIEAIKRELQEKDTQNQVLNTEVTSLREALSSERENVSILTKELTEKQIKLGNEEKSTKELTSGLHDRHKDIAELEAALDNKSSIEKNLIEKMEGLETELKQKQGNLDYITERCECIMEQYPMIFHGDEAGVIMVRHEVSEALYEFDETMRLRIYGAS